MSKNTGTIKCLVGKNKFGFIVDSITGKDVFFGVHSLSLSIRTMVDADMDISGISVNYELGQNATGPTATFVSLVPHSFAVKKKVSPNFAIDSRHKCLNEEVIFPRLKSSLKKMKTKKTSAEQGAIKRARITLLSHRAKLCSKVKMAGGSAIVSFGLTLERWGRYLSSSKRPGNLR